MFGEPGALKLAALAVSDPQGDSGVSNRQTTARGDGEIW
jgi:acyl-CoA dehydrogenase